MTDTTTYPVDPVLTIVVGHRDDGSLQTTVTFDTGETIISDAGTPDLGFDEEDNVLHDVAHTLLTCAAGLRRSPVLERVVDLAPLSQRSVDLEEAASFALQAWCADLAGKPVYAHLTNLAVAVDRLTKENPVPEPIEPEPVDQLTFAVPFDHGFAQTHLARSFENLDAALVWIANEAPGSGRHTSSTGRNIDDVTWYAIEVPAGGSIWTGERHRPEDRHRRCPIHPTESVHCLSCHLSQPCEVQTCFITATHRGVSKVDGAHGSFCNEHTSWDHPAHALDD